MKKFLLLTSTVACLFTSSVSADVIVAEDFLEQDIYVRKDSWQETMLRARARLLPLLEREARNLAGIAWGSWFVAGPFKVRSFDDVTYPIPRRNNGKSLVIDSDVVWHKRPEWGDGQLHLLESGQQSTYLRRNIDTETARTVPVYVGANDGMKLWLNGKEVFAEASLGIRRKYLRKVVLELATGSNELVMAIHNDKDLCGFTFSSKQDFVYRLWERMEADFPVQWDWAVQDGGEALQKWFGQRSHVEIETKMIERVLEELDPHGQQFQERFEALSRDSVASSDVRWLDLYVNACEERRARRIQTLLATSPKIVYTKHHNLGGTHYAYTEAQSDAQRERYFHPDAALCLIEMDGITAKSRTLIEDPTGVIRDPDVSLDAKRILFSWKKSDREDDFHLHEIDVLSGTVRQLTDGLGFADYEGAYLPNGDIVFNSTRCVQTVDCWWTEVSNLYTCDNDGNYLRRLGYDQVHTNYPTVTHDGRIIYTRWDYNDRGHGRVQALFQMNPDGTAQTEFYGNNSWFPNSILHARAIPGTQKVLAIAGGHHARQSGKLILINPIKGRQENSGAQLIAPPRRTEAENIDAYGQFGEQFQYPYPINETEFLVAYEPADWARAWYGQELLFSSNIFFQAVKSGTIQIDPALLRFKIYWMDIDGRRELLAADPEISCNQPIPLMPREIPVKPSQVDYRKDTGTFYMADIYVGPGLEGVSRGAIKKLRVVALDYRAAGIGVNTNRGPAAGAIVSTPIGVGNASWDVKVILGEATVYEDGSACFIVPARTPVYFQALDEQGHAAQTMRSWSTLQPGETFSCVGCHENKNTVPVWQRTPTLAMKAGPQPLEPFYGPLRGFSFIKEIQPILDKHCIRCHDNRSTIPALMAQANREPIPNVDPDTSDRPFSLLGTLDPEYRAGRKWTDSYLALTHAYVKTDGNPHIMGSWDHAMVNWISPQSIPPLLPPYWKGAARSGIIPLLENGHEGTELTQAELDKIACWIDLLVPYCGDYTEANTWADPGMERYNNWFKDDPYTESDPAKRYQHFLNKRKRMKSIEKKNIAALIQKHRKDY